MAAAEPLPKEIIAETKRPDEGQDRAAKKKVHRVKLQLTVDQETVDKLEESSAIHRDASLTQTFRRAASLQNFIDKMQRDGYEVLIRKDGDVYKLFIPS